MSLLVGSILSLGVALAAPGTAAPAHDKVSFAPIVQTGTLAEGDEKLGSGEWIDRFEYDGVAGTVVSVRLTSSVFDTYVGLASDGVPSMENDDATSGGGSLIELTLPRSGRYRVSVTSYAPGQGGAYELRISGLAPVGDPTAAAAAASLPPDAASTEARVAATLATAGWTSHGAMDLDLPSFQSFPVNPSVTSTAVAVILPPGATLTGIEIVQGGTLTPTRDELTGFTMYRWTWDRADYPGGIQFRLQGSGRARLMSFSR